MAARIPPAGAPARLEDRPRGGGIHRGEVSSGRGELLVSDGGGDVTGPRFFYDVGSPYAYLAAARVDALFPAGITWTPVLLGGIFRATGRSSWAHTGARADGMAEVERRAAAYGLPPVRWPARWPNDGLRAMRVATFATARGAGRAFARAAFHVQFAQGRPLDEEEAIASACERAGLDPAEALAAAGEDDVKRALREHTDAALALGVTGVPSVAVAGRVFWGDDRLEEAARQIEEGAPA